MDKDEAKIEAMLNDKGLNAPRLTPGRIDHVIVGQSFTKLPSGKCMVCELTLLNGFTVRGESSCVSKENFDDEIGREISRENAREKIWVLEGYLLQQRLSTLDTAVYPGVVGASGLSFGDALSALKSGSKVARAGWNGKGIFLKLQNPDKNSKMTSPYIFIDTTGLQTDNAKAPKSCVPWLASQTDMLSDDWIIV